MLSRKKLHGDDAVRSAARYRPTRPVFERSRRQLDHELALAGVVAGGAQVAAGQSFHFHPFSRLKRDRRQGQPPARQRMLRCAPAPSTCPSMLPDERACAPSRRRTAGGVGFRPIVRSRATCAPAACRCARRRPGEDAARGVPHRRNELRSAFASDAASDAIIANIFEAMLDYDYLARPVKLVPRTLEAMPAVEDGGRTYICKVAKASSSRPIPRSRASRAS